MTDEEAHQLVRDQVAEMRAAFDTFDTDGDGRLDPQELLVALRAIGLDVDAAEVGRMIAFVDTNGDGVVDFSEFVTLVEPRPPGEDPEADLREAFAVLDTNGDGYLDARELRRAVAHADDIAEAEVEVMIARADVDGDGRISFDEFRDLMKQAS